MTTKLRFETKIRHSSSMVSQMDPKHVKLSILNRNGCISWYCCSRDGGDSNRQRSPTSIEIGYGVECIGAQHYL